MCLPGLVSLTRLALESNLIGNLGLQGLATALAENESLEEIFLYNNDLDDDMELKDENMAIKKVRKYDLSITYDFFH